MTLHFGVSSIYCTGCFLLIKALGIINDTPIYSSASLIRAGDCHAKTVNTKSYRKLPLLLIFGKLHNLSLLCFLRVNRGHGKLLHLFKSTVCKFYPIFF